MPDRQASGFRSGAWQLNLLGLVSLGLLGASAWWMLCRPLTVSNAIPLILIAYAVVRIVYELTLNRPNVPTLATSMTARGKIAQIVAQDAASRGGAGYKIIDLGSGRGELARRVAKAVPQAQVHGVEFARIPYLQARLLRRLLGPANIAYHHADFWPFDCGGAQAVLVYLTPRMAQKAGEKLARELAPGSLAVAFNFPLMGEWIPEQTIEFHAPFKEVIYVYRKS